MEATKVFCNDDLKRNHECEFSLHMQKEIDNVRSELKSAMMIINMLQNDVYGSQEETAPRPKFQSNAKWTEVVTKRRGRINVNSKHSLACSQPIPALSNRFTALQEVEENSSPQDANFDNNLKKSVNIRLKSKKKIVIIGDSHSRGYATNLKHQLKDKFQIVGYVKPGASTIEIVETAKSDIRDLKKDDVIIVFGGSNDIGKNKASNSLYNLVKFASEHQHTNIVVMGAPHRHDLAQWSCVNAEAKNFNNKLNKRLKALKNTTVINIDTTRDYYTRHGLHMNGLGKEVITRIAEVVKELL